MCEEVDIFLSFVSLGEIISVSYGYDDGLIQTCSTSFLEHVVEKAFLVLFI